MSKTLIGNLFSSIKSSTIWSGQLHEVSKAEFMNHEGPKTHSQMEHYFFSYLLTWKVDLIEILEILAQMWQYVIFLSLKPTKVTSDFILY